MKLQLSSHTSGVQASVDWAVSLHQAFYIYRKCQSLAIVATPKSIIQRRHQTMKKLLLTLFAILLIIEEWLWDFLSACGHYLAVLLKLERFERWLSQTSPTTALFAFMIPILIVTPINIAALSLLFHGMLLQGILLEVFAKLLGTLLVARVFTLTKSQLLTFGILAVIYNTITAWLRWAHAKIVDTDIYRMSRELKAKVKAKVKAWLG